MASWNEKYKPDDIVAELDKAKNVDQGGKVNFKGFAHYELAIILGGLIKFNRAIPEMDRKRIINEATFKAAKKGTITPKSLINVIGKLESHYLRRPLTKYRLITTISIDSTEKIKSFRLNSCTTSFKASLPRRIIEGVSKIQERAQHSILGGYPSNYLYVTITSPGRSLEDAAHRGLDTVDLIRAIWNFYINRSHDIRMSSGQRKPVNQVILGPLHTIHLLNGELATDSWWYDPEYVSPIKPYGPFVNLDKLYSFTDEVRKLLKRCQYRDALEAALIRYSRALDLVNWEDAYLRLWSILEFLTGTGYNDNYNVTIKRASFIFGGSNLVKQILNHLKEHRNIFVHEGSENQDIEGLLFQLKRYIEALFEFHLKHGNKFRNISEAASILDQPCDRDILNQKLGKIEFAKQFLQYD